MHSATSLHACWSTMVIIRMSQLCLGPLAGILLLSPSLAWANEETKEKVSDHQPCQHQPGQNRLTIEVSKTGKVGYLNKTISEQQLRELSKKHLASYPEGILCIRGNQKTSFEFIQRVVAVAAGEGLKNIMMATPDQSAMTDTAADEDRQQTDLYVDEPIESIAMPAIPDSPAQQKAIIPPAPLAVSIDHNGTIYINQGPAKEAVETDTSKRDLPKLRKRIKVYTKQVTAAGTEPSVQLYVDPETRQERVVDVLNALASEKISKVAFTSKP